MRATFLLLPPLIFTSRPSGHQKVAVGKREGAEFDYREMLLVLLGYMDDMSPQGYSL